MISDFLHFKSQQASYVAHVIRMPNERSLKQLMFNDATYRKRGRLFKTLLDQVVSDKDVSIDVFCNRSFRVPNNTYKNHPVSLVALQPIHPYIGL